MLAISTGSQDTSEVEVNQTLLAIKEFKRFLEKLEKDISRSAGKLRNKEVSQSARFVMDGIHEAQNYLAIVKKVIEKTNRVLRNKALNSDLQASQAIEKRRSFSKCSPDMSDQSGQRA